MSQPSITLYTAKVCPYAQRTEIALHEVGAKWKEFEIDLGNKPSWYAPQVNPASKVPAIAVGGPDVSPDQPSPESTKIAESLVLVEFIADLYPNSPFRPQDPVERAKGRFFIDQVNTILTTAQFQFLTGASPDGLDKLFAAIEKIQALLPKDKKFALGDTFTFADASVAGWIARLKVAIDNDLGKFAEGDAKKFIGEFRSDKFKRWAKYAEDVLVHKSVKDTFREDIILSSLKRRFARAA